MACIKSAKRSAWVAVSPDGPYMAAGTMAGAVDLSFSSSAHLEVYKVEFETDGDELGLLSSAPTSERFNRLSWSKGNPNSEEFSQGVIAGALIDGTIGVWNPTSLIRHSFHPPMTFIDCILASPEANGNPVVTQLSKHKGPVRGLEFNAITPNMLASGADDGEVCVWDLAKPKEPMQYPALRGTGSATQGEISFLSWNSKVQHILSSTSYNGTTVVWDLKKQKPVISFADSNRRRCSVLQWHPDIATQLVVASDDDDSPALRLWDMRNIMTPVREFTGHTKGVISMAWCPTDSSYLLTCAKDNRTICWDTISGEMLCELPPGNNWNFDIHWYPKIPGVISASSFDGKIGIYNIEACDRYGVSEPQFNAAAAPLRAPKWFKRPVGVSFGFGGRLVSFHTKSSSVGASVGTSEVFVHSLVTEDSLVSRSSEFEAAIQTGERSSLRVLCEKKLQESESEDDRETWGFLKVMFEDDGTSTTRIKLLSHLGFSKPEEEIEAVQDDMSQQVDSLVLEDNGADNAHKETTAFSYDNGEDFFNSLPSPKADTPVSTSTNTLVADAVPSEEQRHTKFDELEESDDPAFDDAVQRALVVGDYKGAVEQCISVNKMADALVIAHVGGPSLWENTRDQYLKTCCSSYLRVVSAMVNRDLLTLVKSRPLKSWKETLALLCTFAQEGEWETLCDALAFKLLAGGNTLAATLCYMCAGNIDKTVEIWSHSLSAEGKSYVDRLQDLMEKTAVFAIASGQKQYSSFFYNLVEKYAEILVSQGQLSTAMDFLKLFGDYLSPELGILSDRIAISSLPEQEEPATNLNHKSPHVDQRGIGIDNSSGYYQEHPANIQPSPRPTQFPAYASYDGTYPASTTHQQPTQSPNFFLPQPSPQAGFPYQPTTVQQPVVRPFAPANVPSLKNAEQYHQPQPQQSGPHFPGPVNTNYQPVPQGPPSAGPMPLQPAVNTSQRLPQAVAPMVPPRGFMPVTNPGVPAQQPGMPLTQPSSPAVPATTQATVAVHTPPPTVQTVDTSSVPAYQKPVVSTLTRLYNETSQALGGAAANPAKKREIDDNSRKLGQLFAKLNTGDISKNASEKLIQLCQALDNGDYGAALQIQVLLTTSEWDECSFWLGNLKRMIKARQNVRL